MNSTEEMVEKVDALYQSMGTVENDRKIHVGSGEDFAVELYEMCEVV